MFDAFAAAFFHIDKGHVLGAFVVTVVVVLTGAKRRSPPRCPRCHQVNRCPAVYCAQCGRRLPGR